MKKLSLLVVAALAFTFYGCSNDDESKETEKKEVIISFEDQLTTSESEFIANGTPSNNFQEATITDSRNMISLRHYYADWGSGYSFAGFTYTNKKSHTLAYQPNCGTVKSGNVYIGTYSDDMSPASFTINEKEKYLIKGLWITTSKNAYVGMTQGDSYARAFKKGDWYKVTATGYDQNNKEVGNSSILLADYKSDTDKPVNDWIWFDLTPLKNATRIVVMPSSSDSGEFGMNTGKYICIDDITLIEK